jgi:hypothetical protein
MKRYHLLFLVIISALSFFPSCEPDTIPPTGDVRDSYTGTWMVTETSSYKSVKAAYLISITKDSQNSSQVLIDNFAYSGSGKTSSAIATASTLTVPSQSPASGTTVSGSGTLTTSKTMSWTYSLTIGGDKTNYTATATKQ